MENKKDRIKRTTRYQDLEKRGIRMTDVDLMFRSLRLAWIPQLLTAGDCNWCTVPYHFSRKLGGLNFLLKCNYDPKYLLQLPIFYRNILKFFKELKAIYGYDQRSDLVLFNNREFLVDNKTAHLNNWVENDVISIKDLLKDMEITSHSKNLQTNSHAKPISSNITRSSALYRIIYY